MRRMKKLFTYLICLAMILSLAGCGKKDEPKADAPTEQATPDNPGGTTETPDQPADNNPAEPGDVIEDALKKAPEHYDFAVEVSINPAFLLFVSGNEVIGYQALNDDAKQIEDRCALVGRGIEGAVEDIVRASHQDGFLKDGGAVNLTIVSANCKKTEADEVLDRAFHTVERTAQECNVSVKPEIHIETEVVFAPEPQPGEPGDPNEPGNPNEPGDPNDPNEYHEPRKDNEGCSVCCGTGVCERCDGTGVVDCMRCNGTGKSPEGTCPDCNGAGRCECEQCHGTKQCPACGGTGKKPD